MKPVSSLENKRMVVPATGEAGETLLEAAVRGQPNRFTKLFPGIRHFQIVEKIGFSPRMHCWCGLSLELNYTSRNYDGMTAALNAFLDMHEGCEAKGEPV